MERGEDRLETLPILVFLVSSDPIHSSLLFFVLKAFDEILQSRNRIEQS